VDGWTGGPVDRVTRDRLRFDMRFAFEPSPESDDFDLDRDFPLGDGTADVEGDVACPYCGEAVVIALDPGSGDRQDYVEDCQVCCQPWRVHVEYGPDGHATITASPADD
jgi:Cysteine-rich CPXCG